MNKLVYLIFLAIFTVDYIGKNIRGSGRYLEIIPEVLSLVAALIVMLEVLRTKKIALGAKYQLFFFAFAFVVAVGILVNTTPPGAVFVGTRNYFKYLPFFLLPAVWKFTEDEIRSQLKFLLVLILAQLPVVLYQRFFQYKGWATGDVVHGTLNVSSILSMVLVAALAIMYSFYLKKKISLPKFALIAFCLFLPTTLNETKGTLILLPVALLVPLWLSGSGWQRIKQLIPALLLGVVFIGSFSVMYAKFYGEDHGVGGISDFITSTDRLAHYLYGGAAERDIGIDIDGESGGVAGGDNIGSSRVGRIDALLIPLKVLSKKGVSLLVGLGIGNVTKTFFGSLSGEYARFTAFGSDRSALSQILWEMGLFGVILSLVFFYLVFKDASGLSKSGNLYGALALGWAGIVIMMVVALPYKNTIVSPVIGYLFWYWSGLLAAERFRQEYKSV